MFSYLGIDWGSKRCGLAFGNPTTGLVLPAPYECPTAQITELIKQEIVGKSIRYIVLGRPTNFQQGGTEVTARVEVFYAELSRLFPEIPIEFVNENGSTKKAKSLGIKDKTTINHLAACDILERYFYRLSQQKRPE